MTVAELRRLAAPNSPAWDSRVSDVGRVAVEIAWAARPASHALVTCSADYWLSLDPPDRARWFCEAWRTVTGATL